MAFFFYLSGRNNVLLHIGEEIIELLNDGLKNKLVHGKNVVSDETLMW